MKPDICTKIAAELDQDLSSERQVVYILVEIRKLLEAQGTLENYPALRLCCDWVVHPKLRGLGAQNVILRLDSYEVERQLSGKTVDEHNDPSLSEIMTLKGFRSELRDALAAHAIPTERLATDEYWRNFIKYFVPVIQDCPLEAWEANTQWVHHVTALAWPDDQASALFPCKLVLQWNWTLKGGTSRQNVVCALV